MKLNKSHRSEHKNTALLNIIDIVCDNGKGNGIRKKEILTMEKGIKKGKNFSKWLKFLPTKLLVD